MIDMEELLAIAEDFRSHENGLLDSKRADYAPGDDMLANFRMVGKFLGKPMSQIALVYFMKHIQAIALGVNSIEENQDQWCWTRENGSEGLKQRFTDARNYLLLMFLCVEDEIRRLEAEG